MNFKLNVLGEIMYKEIYEFVTHKRNNISAGYYGKQILKIYYEKYA